MCITLPGRVVEVVGEEVVVDYGKLGRSKAVNLIEAQVGEYVYVTQKFAVDRVSEDEALRVLNSSA